MTYGQPPSDQGGNNNQGSGNNPGGYGGYQPPAGDAGSGYQPPAGGGYQPPAGDAGGGYGQQPTGGYQPPAQGGYQPPGGYQAPPTPGYPPAGGYQQPVTGGYTPSPGAGYGPPPAAASGSPNVLAIISLIAGVLSILTFCTVFGSIIFGLAGAGLGFFALQQIKTTGQGGRGIAIGGLVTGIIGLLIGIALVGCGALFSQSGSTLGNVFLTALATLTPTNP